MNGNGNSVPLDGFQLWAKGAPRVSGDPYHPLICHLIDVGSVAARLWVDGIPEAARRWFAEQVGLDPASAGQWATFWASSHDIGKASPAFQERAAFRHPIRHGTVSTVILRDRLASPPFLFDTEVANRIATVVGGHHGVFPEAYDVNRAVTEQPKQIGRGAWKFHQGRLLGETARLLGVDQLPPPHRFTNAGALWLAGFISVADWIGSNEKFFPHAAVLGQTSPDFSLDRYVAQSQEGAVTALAALGWSAWPRETPSRTFRELFPYSPNDLQRKTVELGDGLTQPALVIVEAPMGEGKTEAALYLADRGNAALGMRGHYVALPTQATSNQMFGRVREFLGRRYPEKTVNTQLLHGHASLDSDFRALRADERSFLEALNVPEDRNQGFDGAKPGVVAATWFTARKRGLLAPFGVGTVDQALLAVLQTRHFFVRMLGLAGKTVVFDEVHAYDTYMSVLLERLLGWLAALGCSVVLLSATLPTARRDRLLRAYGGDSTGYASIASESAAYPSLTWRSGDVAGVAPITASKLSQKQIRLRWIMAAAGPAGDGLGEQLAAALRDGGCAAVICNTVRGAQQTFRMLQNWFPAEEVSLFHARFLYEDRAARERETLRRFGKPGDGVIRPYRAVLVATQVIEQSLDLDFDLMVTELAPVDLVLQRSGRLHRHRRDTRPAGLREPTLWILGPEERDDLPVFSGGVTHVYAEHVLLRSWLALRERRSLAVPEDVSALIESVYDDARSCPPTGPAGLAARWAATWAKLRDERLLHERLARDVLILPSDVAEDEFLVDRNSELEEDDPQLHETLRALTRLGERSVTAICLMPEEMTRLRPREDNAWARAEALLRRSVGLTDRRIVYDLAGLAPPPSWKTTALLRFCRLVELNADGEAVIGKWRLRIDPELGAVVVGDGEE